MYNREGKVAPILPTKFGDVGKEGDLLLRTVALQAHICGTIDTPVVSSTELCWC